MTGLNLQVGAPLRSEMHLSTLAAGLLGAHSGTYSLFPVGAALRQGGHTLDFPLVDIGSFL